jgi:hypothetical protein
MLINSFHVANLSSLPHQSTRIPPSLCAVSVSYARFLVVRATTFLYSYLFKLLSYFFDGKNGFLACNVETGRRIVLSSVFMYISIDIVILYCKRPIPNDTAIAYFLNYVAFYVTYLSLLYGRELVVRAFSGFRSRGSR